jgi:hypothetical protein
VFEHGSWEEASDPRPHFNVQNLVSLVRIYGFFLSGLGHFSLALFVNVGSRKRPRIRGLILHSSYGFDLIGDWVEF